MVRKLVVAVIGFAVLVLTPYFLYEYNRATSFQFGAEEVRAAVEGTWRLDLSSPRGPARALTFTMAQAGASSAAPAGAHSSRAGDHGWIRPAAACGHRTLVRSAEACIDETEVELTLAVVDGERPAELRGKLRVLGKRFERGLLELRLGDETIRATISSVGEVLEASLGERAVTLARLHPRS